jgi:hypothetical protein
MTWKPENSKLVKNGIRLTGMPAFGKVETDEISGGLSLICNEYRDLAEALASIREFVEMVYNQKRYHSVHG